MAKIAIEHKHSEVFKIFKRNSTPIDRIEQLLDLDPSEVHDCIVDLIELYKELDDVASNFDCDSRNCDWDNFNWDKLLIVDA